MAGCAGGTDAAQLVVGGLHGFPPFDRDTQRAATLIVSNLRAPSRRVERHLLQPIGAATRDRDAAGDVGHARLPPRVVIGDGLGAAIGEAVEDDAVCGVVS